MEKRDNRENGYPPKNSRMFEKSAYYPGKLLHASDFIREQTYGNSKLEFINRKFHGWGIVEGLEVEAGQDGSIRLLKGSAIDPPGRILIADADRKITPDDIEGLAYTDGQDFILGIRYDERTVETEPLLLEKEKSSQPAVIAETYALKAYGEQELQELKAETMHGGAFLMEEKTLYKGEAVTLTAQAPVIVPADSLFRIRLTARTAQKDGVSIGWKGVARLEGAFFTATGEPFLVLEEGRALCAGSLQREWEICTEENRREPVRLEIDSLEIAAEMEAVHKAPDCRFYIETSTAYGQAVRKRMPACREGIPTADWVPLARLRLEKEETGGGSALVLLQDSSVRFPAARPAQEAWLDRMAEENGILDIRWRRLVSQLWRNMGGFPAPAPWRLPEAGQPPMPPAPPVYPPVPPVHPPAPATHPPAPLADTCGAHGRPLPERSAPQGVKKYMRSGVAVISIPKRYKKGQVLLSEEISHGFLGKEVFLWCGRVREDKTHAYWERSKKEYRVLSGAEALFGEAGDDGKIKQMALRQNVAKGTFQIALTLEGRIRRSHSKEVVMAWTALRLG